MIHGEPYNLVNPALQFCKVGKTASLAGFSERGGCCKSGKGRREGEEKTASLTGSAFHCDDAALSFHNGFGQRQTEADALCVRTAGTSVEALENVVDTLI